MKDTIQIRDKLVLEAHSEERCALICREGESDAVRVYLNEVRYLAEAMCSMAAEMAGYLVGDDKDAAGANPEKGT